MTRDLQYLLSNWGGSKKSLAEFIGISASSLNRYERTLSKQLPESAREAISAARREADRQWNQREQAAERARERAIEKQLAATEKQLSKKEQETRFVARELGVTPATVKRWEREGIPLHEKGEIVPGMKAWDLQQRREQARNEKQGYFAGDYTTDIQLRGEVFAFDFGGFDSSDKRQQFLDKNGYVDIGVVFTKKDGSSELKKIRFTGDFYEFFSEIRDVFESDEDGSGQSVYITG